MKRSTDHVTPTNGANHGATNGANDGATLNASANGSAANEVVAAAAAVAAALTKLDGVLANYRTADVAPARSGRINSQQAGALGAIVGVIQLRPDSFVTRKKGQKPQAFDLTTAEDQLAEWNALDAVSVAAKNIGNKVRYSMALLGGELRRTVGAAYPAAQAIADRDEEAQNRLALAEQVYGKAAASRRKKALPEQRALAKADRAAKAQAQQAKAQARVVAANAALERAKARTAGPAKP